MKPKASEQRKKPDFKPRESGKKGKLEKPRKHSRSRKETRQRLSEPRRTDNEAKLKKRPRRPN